MHQFLPHAALLPLCSVVLSHAGAGSVLSTLAHGIPLLMTPLVGDQFYNADRVRREQAPGSSSPPPQARRSTTGIHRLLDDIAIRQVARGVGHEIRAMPLARCAVPAIERLVDGERVRCSTPC